MNMQQHNFINAFLNTGNGAEAYRVAYPRSRSWKPGVCRKRASELLRRPAIAAVLAERRARAESAAVATRQEVLQMLSRVIRGCPAQLLRDDGTVDLDRLREMRQELQEFAVEVTTAGSLRYRVRFRDPIAAAERIAKLQGWDKPQEMRLSGSVGVDRDALREMFRTMSREERREWLQAQLGNADPEAASASA